MFSSRQLAAIMFTDIVGYTSLMGNDEQKAFEFLKKNREIQKPIIAQFGGRWIKELGDGVMASFNNVSDAVNAAIKIQEACDAGGDFQLRIGINLGEVLFEGDDVFGDGVNIAARIQSAARPGSICISESVHHNVINKKDIKTRFVKEELLKNVKKAVRIYEIVRNDEAVPLVETQKSPAPEHSIAVLPFTNMSSDPEQEYFSDGMSEEIINMLAQVPGLKVAGPTSSFTFKGKNQDLRKIGEELSVNYILEGSVRKSGSKLRIIAQLIEAAEGYHLWSEKFDRQLKDIFDIQDEISLAILNSIKIKLFGADKDAVLKHYTHNTEAYQLYLQGRYHYHKWSAEGFLKAINYFKAAIAIEPEYAIAFTGIASCYLNLWFFSHLPPEHTVPQMKQATEHSLALDDQIAESRIAMARLKMYYEWDLEAAAEEFKKAVELNPNLAEAHEQYGYCLALSGNYPEALKYACSAFALDPFSLMNNNHIALLYWMAGDYKKGIAQGKRLIELDPNFYGGHYLLGLMYNDLKRYDEAVLETELCVGQNYCSFTLSLLGKIYAMKGDTAGARDVLVKMEALRSSQSVGNFDMAVIHAGLKEYDMTFQLLEKAVEMREGFMLYLKYYIPNYPEIEKDPRSKQLTEKMMALKK
jgi:serine/threonine-protein kinase